MGQAVVDLALVADGVVGVVNGARAFALVVRVLADESCSVEGFVAAVAVLLPVLEVAFVDSKVVLERA